MEHTNREHGFHKIRSFRCEQVIHGSAAWDRHNSCVTCIAQQVQDVAATVQHLTRKRDRETRNLVSHFFIRIDMWTLKTCSWFISYTYRNFLTTFHSQNAHSHAFPVIWSSFVLRPSYYRESTVLPEHALAAKNEVEIRVSSLFYDYLSIIS